MVALYPALFLFIFLSPIAPSYPNTVSTNPSLTSMLFRFLFAPRPFIHCIAVILPTVFAGFPADHITITKEKTVANIYVQTDT